MGSLVGRQVARAAAHPHKTQPELAKLIIAEREAHPSWGPKKLKVVLEKRYKRAFPAASTIGDVLARAGLVSSKTRRPAHERIPTTLRLAKAPNDLWCTDFKGQFRLGNGTYCYPLTVSDQFSRYLLGVEALPAIRDEAARDVCTDLFRRFGMPRTIRSDNGVPFASRGLAGLTKLSAYWLLLGIQTPRGASRRMNDDAQTSDDRTSYLFASVSAAAMMAKICSCTSAG